MDENSNTFLSDFKKDGYSQEDAYFYHFNRELIEKKRKELDLKRAALADAQKEKSHWMTCPKCGNKMSPVNLLGIQIEQCQKCHGVYFDYAELETLLEAKEKKHFLGALGSFLKKDLFKPNPKWEP